MMENIPMMTKPEQIDRATMWDVGSTIVSAKPATWEGSVLPALRAALDARPETRGTEVGHKLHAAPGMLTATVRRAGQWATSMTIPLGSHGAMAQAVARLARYAVDAAMGYEPPAPEPCPVCAVQIVPGVQCRACQAAAIAREDARTTAPCSDCAGAGGNAHGPCGSCRGEGELPAPPMQRSEAPEPCAPEGYTFKVDDDGDVQVLSPDRQRGLLYWGRTSGHFSANADPLRWRGHERARQWAARLLGETAPPLRTASASERTPLPEGWTWDPDMPCCADGPRREWALVGSTGGMGWHHEPPPPAVHNALVREAARLGLECHEDLVPERASASEGHTGAHGVRA